MAIPLLYSVWQPTSRKSYIKHFSDTQIGARIDAEYYHPKYDELFDRLKENAVYCHIIKDIADYNARGLQPEYAEDGELRLINSQHILEQGLNYDKFDRTHAVNWKVKAKAQVKQYDILTYCTGANVGRTSTYLESEKALAGIDVNILRISQENPIYVGFVMNSLIGRMQTRRLITGSAQAHLYASDIERFIIPFVDKTTEVNIINAVLSAHQVKKTSKALLEAAKQSVEMAIEHDENIAQKWLRDEVERLGVTI